MDFFDEFGNTGSGEFEDFNLYAAPGTKIVGTVTSIGDEFRTNPEWAPVNFVFIDVDGKVNRVFLKGVPKKKFDEAGVSVGDTLGLRYEGVKQTKNGKGSYQDLSVAVKKAAPKSIFD